jgi:hypothetical protein
MHNDKQLAEKYKRITDSNLHRRGHEFDDIGAHLANELYSDRTHFIYELLQNAEDALARRSKSEPCGTFPRNVDFHLFPDRLEIRHFGQPFDDQDIASISDVFKSTKVDNPAQIGKKGIGFKSVYAFTNLPEVHSGSERFQIERFIRLKLAAPRPLTDGQTLFILPFSGGEPEREEKFRQIRDRLTNLDLRPLLFLRQIHEITWGIEGQDRGCYQHMCQDDGWGRRVTLISKNLEHTVQEDWVIFQRPVQLADSSATTVEIAFQLGTSSKDRMPEIVPVPDVDSQLLVYFPTKLDTHLGFLIQGPFKTIANREDIHHSDDWNRYLMREVAELVIETLYRL